MFRNRAVRVCSVFSLAVMLALACGGCKKDKTPPGNPMGFTATAGDSQAALAWTNPTDVDLAKVRVMKGTGGYPATPDEGNLVYEGLDQAFTDTGLQNGTLYYYTAFAADQKGNWSSGVQATATPVYAPALTGDFTEVGTEVTGSGVFDTAQQEALLGLLAEANGLLDGGDACGAGDKLLEFAAKLQEFRGGAAVPVCEELYARARMLRRTLAVESPAKADCPGFDRIDVPAEVVPDPLGTDLDRLAESVEFGEPVLLPQEEGGAVFTKVGLPGVEPEHGAPGLPLVPASRSLFAVPEGAEVSVEFDVEEAETIAMNLWPGQEDVKDAVDPFAKPPFTINSEAYQSDAPFPAEPVRIRDLGKSRDVRIFQLDVAGGQYTPAQQKMTLFKKVNVKLVFQGGAGYGSGHTLGEIEALRPGAVLSTTNWGLIKDKIPPGPIIISGIGEELMILTHPDFLSAANRLAEWKNDHGVMSEVFVVNDGPDGNGPDTAAEIDALVEEEYAEAAPRPRYVLLLGDSEFIPPAYLDGLAAAVDLGSDFIGTDRPLEIVGGDPNNDLLSDIAVGRLPIDTIEEADRVVDRIIAYEGSPPTDPNFYSRAAIAAQFQCCNLNTQTAGVDQRTFIWVSEFARNVMNNNGKTVDRIYAETVDWAYSKDSKPRYYDDGTALPAALTSNFTWNGSTQRIVDAINAGRFIVIHRDHGSPGSWETPWFSWRNIYGSDVPNTPQISNGARLPLVFSVNCASGLFDDESSNGAMGTVKDFELLMERFIRDSDGGAIGVIGDVRNSPSTANSLLLRGYFDAMWPAALPAYGANASELRLGDILLHGKAYLVSQMGLWDWVNFLEVHDEILMWHTFGDPTLAVWTENPWTRQVPVAGFNSWVNGKVRVNYGYPINGITVTATQRGPFSNLVSYGRGNVVNGVALLTMYGTVTPQYDTLLAFSRDNSMTVTAVLPEIQPPANVTFKPAVVNKNYITLEWTNPGGDFSYVRGVRKTGGHPTGPDDGTMVVNGNGTSFTDGPLALNTTYYYTFFSYDVNGNMSSGAHASATTWADITPPPDVTGFTATPSNTRVQLAWNIPASPDIAAVVIVRKAGSAPLSNTDGTVVYAGTAKTYLDTLLTNGTTYYYRAFTRDAMPNYSPGTGAVSATPAMPDASGLTGVPDNGMAHLSWTNPALQDFTGALVVRREGAAPASRTDGTPVYDGPASAFLDTGLTNGTIYHYRVYAHDGAGNYGAGSDAVAVTPSEDSTTPPSPPPTFTATPGPGSITLAWSAPPETDFAGVKIRWSKNAFPMTPAEGQGGRSCDAVTFETLYSPVTAGVTYYYTIFSRDTEGNFSVTGMQAAAVPLEVNDTTPPGEVTGFDAALGIAAAMVELTWTNPTDADFAGVKIQRDEGLAPTTPTTGLTVYEGSGTLHQDMDDLNYCSGKTYYYTCFTRDLTGNYSTGVSTEITMPMCK